MADSYECFTCHRVFVGVAEPKCPSCGGTNGELLSKKRLEDGVAAGTYRGPKAVTSPQEAQVTHLTFRPLAA